MMSMCACRAGMFRRTAIVLIVYHGLPRITPYFEGFPVYCLHGRFHCKQNLLYSQKNPLYSW